MLRQILVGAWSLLVGMKVTLAHVFRGPVTSQYPRERIEMSKAYRNVIVLIEIEGIGSMEVHVTDPLKREWERGVYMGENSTNPAAAAKAAAEAKS